MGEAVEFGSEVEVADEMRRAGDEEEQVFKEAAECAEEVDGLFLAVGAAAIGFRGVEEGGVVGLPPRGRRPIREVAEGGSEQNEGILAAQEVDAKVDVEGAADSAFGEAGGEGAIGRLELGAAQGEQGFKVGGGECAKAVKDGAGTDGGQQLLRVFSEEDERGVRRRLFEDL